MVAVPKAARGHPATGTTALNPLRREDKKGKDEDKTHVDHSEEIGLHRNYSSIKGPGHESHIENREDPARDFQERGCHALSEPVVELHQYTR